MSISSATSMAVATRQWKYDVFLNFRGGDIRRTFLSHLREAFCQANLVTFFDENLMRGEEISPALLKAIEDSNVAVPIFSKDYASSPWCLDELVKIIECYHCKGQIVIPVFYDVSSSVVLEQNGIYGEAFAELERDQQNARYVPQWKAAMSKAANLSGRCARNTRSDSELVKEIVNDVLMRLGRTLDGTESTVATGSGVPKSLSIKVAHTRTVEIEVPGGLRMTKSEDLPIDQLVSLLAPLQHLSEASLQSLKSSNAYSSAPELLYCVQEKNAGQKSTVSSNKTETVRASASAPWLSGYTEGSTNAGSVSSSHISSLPTNSEFFLPGAEDRIVLYVTSSEVITKTFKDCDMVRKILRRFEAPVDERDIADPTHGKELQSALKGMTMSLPLLFIKGEYIGGVEEIEQLKETGQLAKLIEGVSVVGDGKIASSIEQASIRHSWRRVEDNEESRNVTQVGSSEVASSSAPQVPNLRSWRRQAYNSEAKNFTPVGSSTVPSSSGKKSFFLSGAEDKIVLYFTSMEADRKTYEDCCEVRMIFKSFRVAVDERNTYIDTSHIRQLQSALTWKTVSLPEVFIRGKYIGGVEKIRKLNEAGKLKQLVRGFPVLKRAPFCEACLDITYVLCSKCRPGRTCSDCKHAKGMVRCSDCCS